MANPIVIDISHHQPDPIDWQKVKSGGTIGVFHKATEGTRYVDEDLFHRMKAAKEAGLLTATYHFMRETDMTGQMKHYLDTIDPVYGERICLDHEHSGTSLAELEQAVQYVLNVRPDLQITIYSGHLIKEQLGNGYNDLLAKNTSLWMAQYSSKISWPQGTWPAWSLWQYTDRSSVSGIAGPVDGNKWNGTEEALVEWLSPYPAPVEPEPEIAPVIISIQTPPSVQIQVIVNGEVLVDGRAAS